MNRYSLDIFRAPVMHNQGKYCLHEDHMRDVDALKNDIVCYEKENSFFKKRIEEKTYQYEHALREACKAQNDLRKNKIGSNVLFCMVVVLVVIEAWLISGMF
jgi:hypothetical protein